MDAYKLNMQEVGHSGLELRQSGLVINTECAFLGASPDDIVYDPVSEDPNGLLEIKCPYTYRDVNPQEAAQQKTFFCTSENHYLLLKHSITITTKCKGRWQYANGNGVTLWSSQTLAFLWKESNSMRNSGRIWLQN